MSLINQMLRDLEQRRTAEAGVSPLGGLSASGPVNPSFTFTLNYPFLLLLLVLFFVVSVVVAYILGERQQDAGVQSASISRVEQKPLQVLAPTGSVSVVSVAGPSRAVSTAALVAQEQSHHEIAQKQNQGVSQQAVPVQAVKKPMQSGKAIAAAVSPLVEPTKQKDTAGSVQVTPARMQVSAEITGEASSPVGEKEINKTLRPLTDEQRAQLGFQRAVKLLGNGKTAAAQVTLEEALAISPGHVQARETLAAVLLNSGRVSEAASRLREGLQIAPGATPLARLYARILVDQGDVSGAVNVLERAGPAVSEDPDYYALLAALYRQEQKHAQAAQVYQQILMQRPGVASWWMGLALSQDAMGEAPAALKAYQRAQRAGGLSGEVLAYVRSRIAALTPVERAVVAEGVGGDMDEFEE